MSISTNQSVIGLGKGSTWGTAVDVTDGIRGLLTFSNSQGEFQPRDIGNSTQLFDITRLEETADITLTSDLTFYGVWQLILAHILGNDTAAQINVEDYSHTMTVDQENDGEFTTLAWFYDTADDIIEVPSIKWHTFEMTHNRNEVGQIVFNGMADRLVVASTTNEDTEMNALALTTREDAVLGGTNHYFRINADSGAALDSGDDIEIMGYTLKLSRPMEREYVLRGANTKYTKEPKQLGFIQCTLEVRLAEIDHSTINALSLWANETKQKAEIFCDGAQISGDAGNANASYKLSFPKLEFMGEFPDGYGLPSNNQRMRPVLKFNCFRASAAPSGMAGITKLFQFVGVDSRTTTYA